MSYNFAKFKEKLKSNEEWLKKELSSIRTGRATPVVLDNVQVDAYGSKLPVSKVANIGLEDARTLRVSPYDSEQIKPIEKAIVVANLGLGIAVDEKGLRITFPELTTERRTQYVKMAKEKMEESRIRMRSLRDDVWKEIQTMERDKKIGGDTKFRLKEEMEKYSEASQKALLAEFEKKEKEIQS
jgi:ribosome recycling factor